MNPCFPVLFAGNQAVFRGYRTDYSPDNFARLRSDWDCSANQLEQLVSKQDNDAKHEVEPNFPGPPDHDVVTPELLLQAVVKPLRHRAFLVPGRLMGAPAG